MATLNVVFKNGAGSLNVKIYRLGKIVNTVNLTQTGSVELDLRRNDTISIGGVCTGNADISIDVLTSPTTPIHDGDGPINHSLRVK